MGIERVIPVRIVAARNSQSAPLVKVEHARQAIERANLVFRSAGVQFVLRSLEAYSLSYFDKVDDANLYSWSTVRPQLAQVFPNLPTTNPAGFSTAKNYKWMHYVSTRYSPADEITIWVPGIRYDGGSASFPQLGRLIDASPGFVENGVYYAGFIRDTYDLAHEFGHYLGLPHPFDLWGPYGIHPERNDSVKQSDYWDLVFKPGNGIASTHTYFTSKLDAAAYESVLKPIDQFSDPTLAPGDEYQNCTRVPINDPDPNIAGKIRCKIHESSSSAYSEVRYTGNAALRGYSVVTNGIWPPFAANVMSYNKSSGGYDFISDSQALMIRAHLRHEVPIVNSDFSGLNLVGGRTKVGHGTNYQPLADIDFNGDGLRDVVIWLPPYSGGTGLYKIWLSSFANGQLSFTEVQRNGGSLEDRPVPGDYNGDGRTDMAFYRPPVDGSKNGQGYWYWCPSQSATVPSCSTWNSAQWGSGEDVPLAGLHFESANRHDLVVFRPSQQAYYWSNVTGTVQNSIQLTSASPSEPVPDDYDGDGLTDAAVYEPTQAKFRVAYSVDSWASLFHKTFTFPSSFIADGNGATADARGGGMVVRGMHSSYGYPSIRYTADLVLWDASSGNWTRLKDSRYNTSAMQTCQWGSPGDVPLGGLGQPLLSSLAVFRSGQSTGNGFVYTRTPCDQPYSDSSSNLGYSPSSWPVHVVKDMTGDLKPELLQHDVANRLLYISYSDTNYTTWTSLSLNAQGFLL